MLTITMHNVLVVGLVLLHVISVCLALIACMVLEGRVLGVLESIAATLLVGLSVDYLAHVAAAYLKESTLPREQRALAAVAHLGSSITSGAVTTLIGSIFLCFGTITFFSNFGIFLVEIISLSIGATLISFVCALHLFGPEGHLGQIPCPSRRGCKRGSEAEDGSTSGPARDTLIEDVEVRVFSWKARWGTGAVALLLLLIGGIVRLSLSLRSDETSTAVCPEIMELNFTFENFQIPEEQDTYRCRGFSAIPPACTYYITQVDPIVAPGMQSIVHHMLLFGIEGESSSCPYTCFDMPHARDMYAGWAVGVGSVVWPQGTAYAIGGRDIDLQMHYENYNLASGLVDTRSGLSVKLRSTPPENTLTSISIGLHPLGDLEIPPGQTNVTRYTDCTLQLGGPVTVIAFSTHAHRLGTSVLSELRRPSSSSAQGSFHSVVGDVGSTPYYNFNYQHVEQFQPGDERQVLPGDTVRVMCTYDSTSRYETTRSGWGSSDEMCITFIYAYPSEHVSSSSCLRSYAMSFDSQ
jgi:hypothetical protein